MLLDQLEAGPRRSQRSLASDLGIALGLANLLMRRLVRRGWVRMSRVSPGRVLYLITPAGLAAKADLARRCFLDDLEFYRGTRNHVRERLALVAASFDAESVASEHRRVVFYGGGDVAEVAFVCLNEVGLDLAGVVGDHAHQWFRMDVRTPAALEGDRFDGQPFGRLIIMPPQSEPRVRRMLAERGIPDHLVFWL